MDQRVQSKSNTNNDTQTNNDQQSGIVIEEKLSKNSADTNVRKYLRGKMIGKGGFAKCYELTNMESKKLQAVKIIAKDSLTKSRQRQKLISEIKIHKSIKHSYIVQFQHVFEDSTNVYILMEMCTHKTLSELVKRRKRLTEFEVQYYLYQMVMALKYLHSNKIIHRDLKLGNLFLNDKMEIKMGDFGLAAKLQFDGEKRKTICGTPNYIAPEILEGKLGHSFEVDIWSLGVIIYAMLFGRPPFETQDVKNTYRKIKMNNYSFPDSVQISDSARNLITKILVLNPTQRPSLDDILNHSFFQGVSIPNNLPNCTLACPPTSNMIKKYQQQSSFKSSLTKGLNEKSPIENRLVETTPNINNQKKDSYNLKTTNYNSKDNMNNRPSTSQYNELKGINSQKVISGTATQNSVGLLRSTQIYGRTQKQTVQVEDIHIVKFIDYSSKYGLGYLLSNGHTGVYFNDSTKIIFNPKKKCFDYMEKRNNENADTMACHTFEDYPKEMNKKVTLLQNFMNYLDNLVKNKGPKINNFNEKNTNQMVYVKKWVKTKHALLFRLSNKIVQVNFMDKTEIIISSENKILTYINKKQEKQQFALETAVQSDNTEMTKRLKYTKEILAHMLRSNSNKVNEDIM